MNGLKFRFRPIDDIVREVGECGSRMISINDADFFGTREHPKQVMKALTGRIHSFDWEKYDQASVVYRPRRWAVTSFGAATSAPTKLSICPRSMTRRSRARGTDAGCSG